MSAFHDIPREIFALTIPHIQEAIFRHHSLGCQDLANATRVCRAWYLTVSPFLWENVKMVDQSQSCSEAFKTGLVLYGQWIRTLITNYSGVIDWASESPLCTRILKLDISGNLSEYTPDQNGMKTLVAKNPRLKVFRFHAKNMYQTQTFQIVYPKPRGLATLDLGKIDFNFSLMLILRSKIIHLTLQECGIHACTFFVNERFSLPNLKSLVLDKNIHLEKSQLGSLAYFRRFIQTITRLQDLTVVTKYPEMIRSLPRILQTSSLSGLETLSIHVQTMECPSVRDDWARDVLEAVPSSLVKLKLNGFGMETFSNLALINLVEKNNRLTSIRLSECWHVSSATWQTILTTCKFLIEIGGDGSSPLDAKFLYRPWECLDLESFGMSVEVDAGAIDGENRFVWEECENIFSQLSDLKHLKRLDLSLLGAKLKPQCVNQAKDEFLLLWSSMRTCSNLQEVDVSVHVPKMGLKDIELQNLCREIWGDQVKLTVDVR